MEMLTSIFIRFYADEKGLGSEFVAVFTQMQKVEDSEECPKPETYDCDDTYCIDKSLVCNGIRNCRFGWDEESCTVGGDSLPLDMTEPHVIIILLLLILFITIKIITEFAALPSLVKESRHC